MNAKLKKCPFCGEDAYIVANYSDRVRQYYVSVKCEFCGSQARGTRCSYDPAKKNFDDEASMRAIRAWNMRVDDYPRKDAPSIGGEEWR